MNLDGERIASEQMRDRIADRLHAEALKRMTNASGRKGALLLAMERVVRALPGQLAQPVARGE